MAYARTGMVRAHEGDAVSEPPEETQPIQPLDQSGVPSSWSPAWQERTVSQPGIPPSAPGTQGTWPGGPQPPSAAPVAARDHPFVSLIWDGFLLIITVVLVGAALATTHQAHLADIIRPIGYLGLIATGFALSLRTGTPNLAVGAIAGTTGVIGAHLAAEGSSVWAAMAEAVAIATGAGLIAGLVVAALSVPAWAATLALAALAESAALGISNGQLIPLHVSGTYPAGQWIAAFVAVSVAGGMLWLVPGVRSALSKTRSAGEPGRWAGLGPGLGALIGLAGSSLLAGAGGASMAIYDLEAQPSTTLDLTLIAFAATAVGGVSVYGRRAGVLGTVLGVVIVQTVVFLMTLHAISASWFNFAIGGLIVLGLGVNRVLESITETLNRRRAPSMAPPAGYTLPGPGLQPGP
jgi:ribose/xylose/arabinose/galactoside ABC-type transport system permease subunit